MERLARARAQANEPPLPEPLVLGTRRGSRREVAACSAAAAALGIRPGEPLAAACARVPGLQVAEAEPEADRAALTRLARWMQARISPLVALDPPDGLWLESAGASHLFGGEQRLLQRLLARLAASGITARAGLAETAGAAHALARFAPGACTIAPPHTTAEAIAPLPVAALRLQAGEAQALARLGIASIGDLLALPRAALGRRFGLALLRRLDQALGQAGEPLDHLPHETARAAAIMLAEPVAHAAALHGLIDRLAPQLARLLERRGEGARALDLLFHRIDGTIAALRAGTAAPTREPAHIARLLHLLVEDVDPGFGIEMAVLACPRAAPLAPRQLGTGPDPATLAEVADRLSARLGPGAVFRVAPRPGAFPEATVAHAPPGHPAAGSWPRHLPRPTRLLDPPERIEAIAMLPDRPPAAFRWRGRRHRVRAADGPERMHAAWWEAGADPNAVRDYFTVELEDGTRLWLYRSGDGEDPDSGDFGWHVQGLFG